MNKRQAEGKVNSRLYSRTEKEDSTLFSNKNKKQRSTIVSSSKIIFAY